MSKKTVKFYRVPDEYWHRIHFVRPRFKKNIENVLLYMANECCRIPTCTCEEYSEKYFRAIKLFPGNLGKVDKTLDNWRTEIPALFGFYKEDKDLDITETSPMAFFLHENQDLTQFLRLFLLSFQFPGGHLKPKDIKDIIDKNIRFKPAKLIVQVLMEGNKILSQQGQNKEMYITAEEATYCIFNDTRMTSGAIKADEIAKIIIQNREDKQHKIRYYNPADPQSQSLRNRPRSKGDMTRYAGDILDYMEIANLLAVEHRGVYKLKGNELNAIDLFAKDESFFAGYEQFYDKTDVDIPEISKIEPLWFEYVNQSMNPDLFKTDIRAFFKEDDEILLLFDERIRDVVSSEDRTLKDIGDLGEAIVCGHEKMRLKINGYERFVKLVQIVDSPSYHPGFDIDSYEADGTENHRYVEVKTTISKKPIEMYGFHMSTNEWNVASTIQEHYCVYRLMLSEQNKTLIVLRNPVSLYKKDMIDAVPRDGMEITFSGKEFKPTELLTWRA